MARKIQFGKIHVYFVIAQQISVIFFYRYYYFTLSFPFSLNRTISAMHKVDGRRIVCIFVCKLFNPRKMYFIYNNCCFFFLIFVVSVNKW